MATTLAPYKLLLSNSDRVENLPGDTFITTHFQVDTTVFESIKQFTPKSHQLIEEYYLDTPTFDLVKNNIWVKIQNSTYTLKYCGDQIENMISGVVYKRESEVAAKLLELNIKLQDLVCYQNLSFIRYKWDSTYDLYVDSLYLELEDKYINFGSVKLNTSEQYNKFQKEIKSIDSKIIYTLKKRFPEIYAHLKEKLLKNNNELKSNNDDCFNEDFVDIQTTDNGDYLKQLPHKYSQHKRN